VQCTKFQERPVCRGDPVIVTNRFSGWQTSDPRNSRVVASWELCMSDKEDIIDAGFIIIGDSKCFACIVLQ